MPDRTEFFIFRATKEKYAHLLDGVGAAQSSHNRWNEFGQRVVYAASSRALALLELRVHSPWGPPSDTVISVIRIELAEHHIQRISSSVLPDGWRDPVDVRHCQIRGSRWYTEDPDRKMLIVPSVVVPQESIFVFRAGVAEAELVSVEQMEFDERLWDLQQMDSMTVPTASQES